MAGGSPQPKARPAELLSLSAFHACVVLQGPRAVPCMWNVSLSTKVGCAVSQPSLNPGAKNLAKLSNLTTRASVSSDK